MSTERSETSTSERGATAGQDPSDEQRSDAGAGAHGNGSTGSLEEDGAMVDWREQLRERVRQIRARKMAAQRADEAGLDEPRDVAESIAASAARAQELRHGSLEEDVGSEADRSYDDTPDHTTFELDEPRGERRTDDSDPEPEVDTAAEEDAAEEDAAKEELEAREEPPATGDDEAPDESPDPPDDVPMFQDDAEPFGEGTALPADEKADAGDREEPEEASSSGERPVTGWWPKQPRDDRSPDLPADADVPVWARARSRKTDPQGDADPAGANAAVGAEATGATPDVEPERGTDAPRQDEETPAADDETTSVTPPGSDPEEQEAPTDDPDSELADVPIPSWALSRQEGRSRPSEARRDAEDGHVVGEFRGGGERRDDTDRAARRDDGSASAGEHADAPPAPDEVDDMELPFRSEEAASGVSADPADAAPDDTDVDDGATPATEADADRQAEPERSALEELLGEADFPSPPGTERPASGKEGAHDATPPRASSPGSEGLPDDLLPASAPERPEEPAATEATARTDTTPDPETIPDAEEPASGAPETTADPEEGAVPAAARSVLDLDLDAAPATPEKDPDLDWDPETPADPDTVLDAQKPRRQVDESSAPLSDRFFSALCDSLVLLAVGLLLVGGAARAAGASMVEILVNTPAPLAATWLVFAFAYAIFFNGTCGQTLGKMIMRVRVIGAERFHVGYGRAARRAVSYLLATLPGGLGLLPALRDGQQRALHDRLSGTRVVKA